MKHFTSIKMTDKDVPMVDMSMKEWKDSERAYKKFIRRRGLKLSENFPKWEKEK